MNRKNDRNKIFDFSLSKYDYYVNTHYIYKTQKSNRNFLLSATTLKNYLF